MRRLFCGTLVALLLLAAGCRAPAAPASAPQGEERKIVATTYPIYLLACAVTRGVEGVSVTRLDTGSVSCLHNYLLSVSDMRKLEGADLLAINGLGLEDFMSQALDQVTATVIVTSAGVGLLDYAQRDDDHDHDAQEDDDRDYGEFDPHIWMSPSNAQVMLQNLVVGLSQADPDNSASYQNNGRLASEQLEQWDEEIRALFASLETAPGGLITFHDGFAYFADAFGLTVRKSIEEEPGSEASAQEINEIIATIRAESIPVIFTEVNGSDATAQAIARETGVAVSALSMLMDGPDDALSNYGQALLDNARTIAAGFAGEGAGT